MKVADIERRQDEIIERELKQWLMFISKDIGWALVNRGDFEMLIYPDGTAQATYKHNPIFKISTIIVDPATAQARIDITRQYLEENKEVTP